MQEYLEKNGVFVNEPQLLALFDRYDANRDGKIHVSEVRKFYRTMDSL